MTSNLNRLPRYFDAKIVDRISLGDVPTIVSGRHPHLSSAQHQERLAAAAHESIHFLIALLFRTTNFGSHAYIRVPGKSSKHGGKHGARGSVPIGNLESHKADMMVSLAGSIVSGMVDPDNEIAGRCDQKDYAERLAEYANEKGISVEVAEDEFGQMVIDGTAATLVQYWPTIDWLATALLLNCSANGDIKLWPIIEHFYSNPKALVVPARSIYFQVPQKYADYVAVCGLTASVPQEW
jgi:hypothetical protein